MPGTRQTLDITLEPSLPAGGAADFAPERGFGHISYLDSALNFVRLMTFSQFSQNLRPVVEIIESNELQNSVQRAIQSISRLSKAPQGPNTPTFLTRVENARKELQAHLSKATQQLNEKGLEGNIKIIGGENVLTATAEDRLAQVFAKIPSNPPIALSELEQYSRDLQRLVDLVNSLSGIANGIQIIETDTRPENAIEIFFKEEASIDTLEDLGKAAAKWNQVIIACALLDEVNDRSVRVENVRKGSLVLLLVATSTIVLAFGKVVDKALDTIKKCLEIKKLALETKRLQNPDLEKTVHDLEQAARLKARTEATRISTELCTEYKWNEDDVRGDVNAAVRFASEYVLKFLNKGGELSVRVLDESGNSRTLELQVREKGAILNAFQDDIARLSGGKKPLELADGEDSGDDRGPDPDVRGPLRGHT